MSQFTINGTRVKAGESCQVNFQIAKLPTHTVIDLPVFIYRGKKAGPVLLLTAGIHGDELNGVETIRRMIVDKSIVPDNGSVIAVPIVNIYGFLNNNRYLPDGRDLNRCFPGNRNGSLASRIAYILMKNICSKADFGIDFHTGGQNINYPQIRCDTSVRENLELARSFSPPIIVNSGLRDGSFRRAAWENRKTILVFESGESMRMDENSITQGIEGVIRFMQLLKMKKGEPPASGGSILVSRSSWIRAGYSGMFRPYRELGERVKKNDKLASITDPFGDTEYVIKSRFNGYILSIRSHPIVNRGDALINIGIADHKGVDK